MKNTILTLLLLFTYPIASISQTTMVYELDNNMPKLEQSLENGTYNVTLFKAYDPVKVSFKISKIVETEEVKKPEFSITQKTEVDTTVFKKFFTFEIKPRTKVTIKIKEIDKGNNKTLQEHTYIFRGIRKYKWFASAGLSGTFHINSDTYKTLETEDIHKVVKDGSQNIIDGIPVVQFTYLNIKKDIDHGVTGGVGYDTSNLSFFAGYSLAIGQFVFLTGGVVLHNQLRLDSQYHEGQTVANMISMDQLNTPYYRFNPFISITLGLGKELLNKNH